MAAGLEEHQAHGHEHHEDVGHAEHDHPADWIEFARIAFVGAAIVAVWLRLGEGFVGPSVLGSVAACVGGWPILREAIENAWERRMTMELSMTIALAAALLIGEVQTGLVIIFFVLIAEVLEGLTVGRGRQAIGHLLDLLPRTATVRRSGTTSEVHAEDIKPDDIVIVKPGGRLPIDGIVVGGYSAVDQAPITGESMPVDKSEGDEVYAGTINQSGALEVRVTRLGRDTAFGKIIDAVERADKLRAPIQKTADRLAGYLVYFALGSALLTYLITRDARSTISVIIVAGACGIAAGTPLAVLGAIGRAARGGAIIKGGIYLEALGKVDTIVFDKTGTVTLGKLKVTEVRTSSGASERDVLEAAATAENKSEHPIARAILERAAELSIRPSDTERFDYTPGKGIACSVEGEEILVGNEALFRVEGILIAPAAAGQESSSQVFVSRGGRMIGSIFVADTLRPEAKDAVTSLQSMGLRTVLLTGDSTQVASSIAASLGIDDVEAELLPEQKAERVKSLTSLGRRVAMLGDGINDAPALIAADVGVAMGGGTDVARESADIVLIGNDLSNFVETVRTARWCHRIIMTNFAGTLTVDAVGVGLAAFGYLNPLVAALIHVVSELAFILNSARLLPAAHDGRAEEPVRTEMGNLVAGRAVEEAL